MPFRRPVLLPKLALLLPLLLAIGACSLIHHQKYVENPDSLTAKQMYQRAHTMLANGNWSKAETAYRKLIARFPYGSYNEQAQIDLAYTLYKEKEPSDAYSTINEFIKTYPTNKHIAYAYYLRGLINFDRTGNSLQKLLRIDPSRFDDGYALQSFDDFNTLVTRFPNTRYAVDARQRMIYLRNQLAQSELNVAEYYLERHAYVAAAHRARYIIEHYQLAPQVADALAVLAKSYHGLGRDKLAAQTTQVLKLNYPDHPYLKDPKAWPKQPSWISKLNPLTSAD